MADEELSGRRRSRASRGKLKRFQEIEHVVVEETFLFNEQNSEKALEGCYVSATVNNRRYYGVLVDQPSLKAASMLHFQDEARSLNLNRRIRALQLQKEARNGKNDAVDVVDSGGKRRHDSSTSTELRTKKPRIDSEASDSHIHSLQQIQKFRFVTGSGDSGENAEGCYRVLLATYANIDAASEDDPLKGKQIESACLAGGDFVGEFYYQFEMPTSILEAVAPIEVNKEAEMRLSASFEAFLRHIQLPTWHPLSNLPGEQQKLLSLLQLKKDSGGNVVWDTGRDSSVQVQSLKIEDSMIPMEPRACYRVCVVGGGIAGLSCCLQIFRECERENIPVEITLLEGRSRLGGRLFTDRTSFKKQDGSSFPVDLGASWIHGVELNPLAELAREAGVSFITTSEEVKMLDTNMQEVDPDKDEFAGKVFDKLLDLAVEDCWERETTNDQDYAQDVVRWYASGLSQDSPSNGPVRSEPPEHRRSSDLSVDVAIGKAIGKYDLSTFANLSDIEKRMLVWNMKNIEYALGANISDLSMRFWDIDERHAFEGDHVILREGYSTIVEYLHRQLKSRGSRFQSFCGYGVNKIEYSRTTRSLPGPAATYKNMLELSDTCKVSSRDDPRSFGCDFVVCCVPLGVLKESVSQGSPKAASSIEFDPPLPFTKVDAIRAVGFGLLNKIYLEFPTAFWRNILIEDETSFGNASGVNPHHYMFVDIGKVIDPAVGAPAILMSLVSGCEAAKCEMMTDSEMVAEITHTLGTIFSAEELPQPSSYKVTRWGKDEFARGSYTFLPPGTTDQDFSLLKSPINGNGDSILLEGSETMRLFFAGEHTTALHPSMAHGAMLSGIRAGDEVIATMSHSFGSSGEVDRVIPMPIFRKGSPKENLHCYLCGRRGSTAREGSLFAFKRGSRQVLVHNNCAENSPGVKVFEGTWKNVLKTVTQSQSLRCWLCGKFGASIGCLADGCGRYYHFRCSEDTGWRFHADGKEFLCDEHRTFDRDDCDRISMRFFVSKCSPDTPIQCALCGIAGDDLKAGKLIAFQRRDERMTVHENCIRLTTSIPIVEDHTSSVKLEFRNAFEAVASARNCKSCGEPGATISCTDASCSATFHFHCALDIDKSLKRKAKAFRCNLHEKSKEGDDSESKAAGQTAPSLFQHALFSLGVAEPVQSVPGNLDIKAQPHPSAKETVLEINDSTDDEFSDEDDDGAIILSAYESQGFATTRMARMWRESFNENWNVHLCCIPSADSKHMHLSVAAPSDGDVPDELEDGDIVMAINGAKIGSSELNTMDKVLSFLDKQLDVIIEVQRE